MQRKKMTDDILTWIELILQTGMLLFVFIRSVILVGKHENTIVPVFFCFGTVCFLISDLYWIAHTLIHPGVRIPFAANLMGENAMFLLYAAVLTNVFKADKIKPARVGVVTLFAALFAAASTALWIAWSGEWIKDVISGIMYGYFLCVTARSLKAADALSRTEWILTGLFCVVLIATQTSSFFVDPQYWLYIDLLGNVIMIVVIIRCVIKIINSFKTRRNNDQILSMFHILL